MLPLPLAVEEPSLLPRPNVELECPGTPLSNAIVSNKLPPRPLTLWRTVSELLPPPSKTAFNSSSYNPHAKAEWKPVSLDRFGDISELIKSVGSLKVAETKPQGSESFSRKAAPSNPTVTKPTTYRPPHANQAAAI